MTHLPPPAARVRRLTALLAPLRADLALARQNLLGILRHSPPEIAQFILGLWAAVWGANALRVGAALYATGPRLYLWMHTGALARTPAWGWGLMMLALGLWQGRALVWPVPDRPGTLRRAARALCGVNAAMTAGFYLSSPASPAWLFHLLLTAVSAWCLWRLTERPAVTRGRD